MYFFDSLKNFFKKPIDKTVIVLYNTVITAITVITAR